MTPTPIRTAIARAMESKGVSQSALARATGVGQGRISRYLAGAACLRSDAVERIVVELGLSVKGGKHGK
jgi:predicted transcriptional regulator